MSNEQHARVHDASCPMNHNNRSMGNLCLCVPALGQTAETLHAEFMRGYTAGCNDTLDAAAPVAVSGDETPQWIADAADEIHATWPHPESVTHEIIARHFARHAPVAGSDAAAEMLAALTAYKSEMDNVVIPSIVKGQHDNARRVAETRNLPIGTVNRATDNSADNQNEAHDGTGEIHGDRSKADAEDRQGR